jgi:hypothetical protein
MATEQQTRKIGRKTLRHASEDTKTRVKDVFKLNIEANALKRQFDAKRKELFKQQKAEGITSFTCDAIVNGKKVTIESTISTPQRQVVDVEILRKLVPEDVFMQCISATQKSVVDQAGKAIFDQVSTAVDGTEAVSVKSAK